MATWILEPGLTEAEFRARHMMVEDLEAAGAIDCNRGSGALPGGRP